MPRIVGKYNDIHKTANIPATARVCGWYYIGPYAHIGRNAVIGNFCEINSGATIGCVTMINSHGNINGDSIVANNMI